MEITESRLQSLPTPKASNEIQWQMLGLLWHREGREGISLGRTSPLPRKDSEMSL